jgi:hypothetical protein
LVVALSAEERDHIATALLALNERAGGLEIHPA